MASVEAKMLMMAAASALPLERKDISSLWRSGRRKLQAQVGTCANGHEEKHADIFLEDGRTG